MSKGLAPEIVSWSAFVAEFEGAPVLPLANHGHFQFEKCYSLDLEGADGRHRMARRPKPERKSRDQRGNDFRRADVRLMKEKLLAISHHFDEDIPLKFAWAWPALEPVFGEAPETAFKSHENSLPARPSSGKGWVESAGAFWAP